MKKRSKRWLALLVCLPLLCGLLALTPKKERADAAGSYTITTYDRMQTFDGWGTSLIWWANNVGQYDWKAGGGGTVREEIMELLYGESGLQYNIARFNVGGGDNPNHDHVTKPQHMQGYSTLDEEYLPQYSENVTEEVEDWAYSKNEWTMEDVTYNWDADAAQRWCMKWIFDNAEKLGTTNELITEYFSNSPPWYMTKSACASGAVGSSDGSPKDNLLAGREDEFAQYFTDVLLHLVNDEGYTFQYVDPFNESTSGWWPARSQKQEGCYLTNQQRADVLYYLVKELDKHPELDHIQIAFDDSTGADKAWNAYKALKNSNRWNDVKSRIGKLNYHLYEGSANSQKEIAQEAVAQGWQNWMSEMGYNSDKSETSSILQTGYLHTDKIRETIYNGANAYVLWQVIEELSSQLNAVEYGFGPIKVSYYSVEEVPELANYGYTLGSYHVGKQYYMLGQYSKYIRPGYSILPTSDNQGVAAISPDGKKVVLVHTNNSASADNLYYTLNGHYIKSAQVIVTDENQNWAKSTVAASGNKFSYTVNPYSVTTFVFDVEQYAEKPTSPNKTTVSIKEGGTYEKLASGTALPDIAAINAGSYTNDKFYLTNGWTGFDGDSQYVRGNADGSVGAFIKFTNCAEADVVFSCKKDGAADAAPLTFTLYEDGVQKDQKTGLKATSANAGDYKTIYSVKDLDKSKNYVLIIAVIEETDKNQWTNLSRIDLYDTRRIAPSNYDGPELTAATIRNGGLYVRVNDATPANQYNVYWCKVGTSDVQQATKTVSDLNGATAIASDLTDGEYAVWVTAASGEKKSETKTVRNVTVDEKLLYYVDAATSDVGHYTIYERAGANNTYKDQAFGVDPISGKEWGMTSVGNKKYASGTAGTIYQALGDVVSSDGNTGNEIIYKFEVEAGNYDIMLGVICPWSARAEDVTINGKKVGSFTIDKKENFISITDVAAVADNSKYYITVKVSKPSGAGKDDGSLLGTIMIAKHGDTANAFASAADLRDVTSTAKGVVAYAKQYRFESLKIKYDAEINPTTAYVYGVDGSKTEKTEGVTFDRVTIANTVPNSEVARLTGVVDGLYFNTPLTLTSGIATVYYLVDCGSDGKNPAEPYGTLQDTYDKQSSNGSWGYSSAKHNSGWRDEEYGNSIHYDFGDDFYYTFTGLTEKEKVNIEVGSRSYDNWSASKFEIWFGPKNTKFDAEGNKKLGTIERPKGGSLPKLIEKDVTVPAETCYMFFHKTEGDKPSISYISISTGEPVPSAPVLNKQETVKTDTVKVSGLPIDDLLVLTADDGRLVKEFAITAETMDINLGALNLPEETQALMFSVRHDGSLEESTPTMLAFPSVLVSGVREAWSDKMVLHFTPSLGVTLQKLVVSTPSGKRADVTKREYFNYVVRENGTYTVQLTTKANETYTQTIDIDKIDVITINAQYANTLTDQDVSVTVTLDCKDGALDKFYIDDVEQTIAESYTITATENKKYVLKAKSVGGNEYVYELDITNIDKADAAYTVTPDFTVADGFVASLVSDNISGGTFAVTKDEKSYGGKNGLRLVEAGTYTVNYTSGSGKTKSFTVTLGYGTGTLATLTDNVLSGISGAKVYRLGKGEEVTVENGSCTLTEGYRYMVLAEAEGNYEAMIVTVEATAAPVPAPATTEKKGCGSAADAAMPMVAVLLLLAGAALAIVKGGKRA